jgi:outer membrane immunogenic protein
MKKLLLAGVAGLTLGIAGSANAADLGRPVYKAPPPVAPVPLPVRIFSWTGCYVGGNIGGAWGRKDFSSGAPDVLTGVPASDLFNANSLLVSTGVFDDVHTSGFIGGGQLGCNYQFAGNWVIGFDGDFDWGNVKGDRSGSVTVSDGTVTTAAAGTLSVKTEFLATATVRLGYAWDRFLFYGKGGVAVAHDKYNLTTTATETILGDPLSPFSSDFFFNTTERRIGWTAGAGIEWAFWDNWSAKLEWDFLEFGSRDITFVSGPDVSTWRVKQEIQEVKFGINYLFNWGAGWWGKGKAPVLARY